ncbi:hypothetical protein [Lachnoclostridium sp. Marseille-P6806]|uniref:hypothetical protein n=1 Tax=Lachnoclostridium sp. Marseille-P6806 TaxID=2364793 RepID=UPI00102F5F5C|nr:hypothetical protein [Lachnoclostridium sp. Marseille-P6806]
MEEETKDTFPGADHKAGEDRKTDGAATEYTEYEKIPPEVLTVDRLIGARFDVGQREAQKPESENGGPIVNPLPEPVRISRGRMEFDHPDAAGAGAPSGNGAPVTEPAFTFDVDIEDGDDFDI